MNDCNGNVRALEQRDLLIKWTRRVGCVALVAAVGFGGFRYYGTWREQHLGKQTEQFVARGDFQNAVLVARRLLELDPNSLVAYRAMAEMAEKSGKADAVTWRRKIVQLEPAIPSNQLALARVALRFGQLDLAERVLNALPEASQQGAEYHQLAGAEALGQRDSAKAESHFAAAVEAAPQDARAALNLAIIRLASADQKVLTEARASLAKLTEQPAVRVEALRSLAADALARGQREEGAKWASQLRTEPAATFSDALLYFEATEGSEAASVALAELQAKAAASPTTAAELITWLNRHGLAQVAAHWNSLLPENIRNTQPVPLAFAESLSFLQDWSGLRDFVDDKNWGEFEAIRLAVESHALHRLSPSDRVSMQAQTTWRAALKSAQARPEQLVAIARLADGWGYHAEMEEAWWTVANSNENATTGLSALQRFYKSTQDTRGLLRVAKRALELNPNDLVAANNCASYSLLLNGDSTARRLALKLHSEHPTNRAFAATYAFALHTEGKTAEGLQLLESLQEEVLRHPAIAAYYVVMLVDSGNIERARAYLPDAKRASLLPEEQQLLAAASRKLNAGQPTELASRSAGAHALR